MQGFNTEEKMLVAYFLVSNYQRSSASRSVLKRDSSY